MWKNLFSLATSLVGGSSVQVYIYLSLVLSSFGAGFYVEHLRFAQFQDEVRIVAEKQIVKNEEVKKEQEIINRSKNAEYQANINNIHNFYQRMLDNPSSSTVSSLPNPTSLADAKTQYIQLASSCADTTQQLVSLQEWINEQLGLK